MSTTKTSTRGGARVNAGRKKGSSVYRETTYPIRIPASLLPTVKELLQRRKAHTDHGLHSDPAVFFPAHILNLQALPLFAEKISAGFPSPADDHVDKSLDLNELLISNPATTFFCRVQGESMLGAGIHPNDLLIVNRELEADDGKIIICALNGELTVKRLLKHDQQWVLHAENPNYPDIPLHDELDIVVWGVVTNVIHALS